MTTAEEGSAVVRTVRVLSAEEIALQAGRETPGQALRIPERHAVFADRQLRLRQLAASHPMRDYLLFVADVASAQHHCLQADAAVTVPDATAMQAAGKLGQPPLPATAWPRDAVWRSQLRALLTTLRQRLPAGAARDTVDRLVASPDDWLEHQADRLLQRVTLGLDLAAAPLIAAGLQVYWTQLVLHTAAAHGAVPLTPVASQTQCPCCGSLPTASVTRIGADESGFRYLHCALCSTQWHHVRIKCTHCDSTKGIHYQQLQAQRADAVPVATGAKPGAVRAECCDACGHYLKLVSMEHDTGVEPVADDLASIALDLLVSEAGFERSGHNLMLLFGDSADDSADDSAKSSTRDDGGGG